MEALTQTTAKRVHVQGTVDVSELDGIRDLHKTNEGVSFLYGGDINKLIQLLAKQRISDLSVSEPDLEEIFMHYYTNGGEKK